MAFLRSFIFCLSNTQVFRHRFTNGLGGEIRLVCPDYQHQITNEQMEILAFDRQGTQQQRPVSLTVTLTWHASKCETQKLHSFRCRLSFGVRTPPCAIACINICALVKDPVVYVRVPWIMETLEHPACTVGCFPWKVAMGTL